MQAIETIDPLLKFIEQYDDEEWDTIFEDLSLILSRFGPTALPLLKAYLADTDLEQAPRVVMADAISYLGDKDPSQRDACVAILSQQLERSFREEEDRTLNGILIDCLLDLEAVECSELMQKVFAADMVDEEIISGWEEAQAILSGEEFEEEFDDEYEFDDDPFDHDDEPDEPDEPPGPRRWDERPAEPKKTPKERAEERAKERKKQKKKKK